MFRNRVSRRIAMGAFLVMFGVWAVIAVSAIKFVREQSVDAARIESDVPAVFAVREIKARRHVAAADIELRFVPLQQRHPNTATTIEEAAGKIARQTLFSGEQVLSSKLTSEDEFASLALSIEPGRRAIAVSLNEVIGAGGLILPGDRVDVIAVFDDDVRTAKEAGFVLQNVRVLAVAQSLQTGQVAQAPVDEKCGPARHGCAVGDPRRDPGRSSEARIGRAIRHAAARPASPERGRTDISTAGSHRRCVSIRADGKSEPDRNTSPRSRAVGGHHGSSG